MRRSTPRSRSRIAPVSRSDRSSSTGATTHSRPGCARRLPRSSRTPTALDRFVSEREAADLAHAAAFRAERYAIQTDQIARLADRLPLPRSGCRSCTRPTSAAPRSTCSPTRSHAGSRRCEARRAHRHTQRRHLLRQRRRRQDHDRGRDRARRRAPWAQRVRRDDRPRPASRRRARSRTPVRHRERDRPVALEWFEHNGAGREALRADARHEVDVRLSSSCATRPTRPKPSASWRTRSIATSPARWAARRNTWRWRSCTSCTTKAASTSSSSTRRRPATRSTSSTRRAGSRGCSTTASSGS